MHPLTVIVILLRPPLLAAILVTPSTLLAVPFTVIFRFVVLTTVWLPLELFMVTARVWARFRRVVSVSRLSFPAMLGVPILTPWGRSDASLMVG